MDETRKIEIKNVDVALWHRVKIAAAFAGMSLREWTIQAIEEKLMKDGGS